METAVVVDKDLVLDYATFLEILQLIEHELFVVEFKHSLRLFGRFGQSTQNQCFILGHTDNHEPPQRNR